jgi:predicted nucleic acid-binding protein
MTLVVADTTPLRYLVEIDYESLLPRLFGTVWVPGTVLTEMRDERTPVIVRAWVERLPSWVQVREITGAPSEHEPSGLDRGEWEAIQLARQLKADLLLIDERIGARVAREQGFAVTGTLGVLVEAARSDLISIEEAVARLAKTTFRRTPDLFARTEKMVQDSKKS